MLNMADLEMELTLADTSKYVVSLERAENGEFFIRCVGGNGEPLFHTETLQNRSHAWQLARTWAHRFGCKVADRAS